MHVVISNRHMEVSQALKDYANDKVQKLLKYFDRVSEIEVICDKAKDDHKKVARVEVIVHADRHEPFVAHHDGDDAYGCLDECVHKLERQLSEHKKTLRNRKHVDG